MSKDADKKRARRRRRKIDRRRRKRALDADAINTRLTSLRQLVYDGPTPHAWTRICELLQAWPDDPSLEMALDYAEQHMADWPDTLKRGAGTAYSWILNALDGRHEPRARLVRVAKLRGSHATPERLERLLTESFMEPFVGLELELNFRTTAAVAQRLSLRDNSKLKVLDLSGCRMGAHAIEMLERGNFTNLRVLDLSHNNLDPVSFQRLAANLDLPHLHTLNLGGNRLAHGLEALARARFWGAQLRSVDLSGRANDPNTVIDALERCAGHLEHLALNWVDFSSAANRERLGDLIDACPALTSLDLRGCLLADAGVRDLARITMPTVERLDLTQNYIAYRGLHALLTQLSAPRLHTLTLDHNHILPELGARMAQAHRPALKLLTFHKGSSSEGILVELLSCAEQLGMDALFHDVVLLLVWERWPHAAYRAGLIEALPTLINRFKDRAYRERLDPNTRAALIDMLMDVPGRCQVKTLRTHLRELGVRGYSRARKDELMNRVYGEVNRIAWSTES